MTENSSKFEVRCSRLKRKGKFNHKTKIPNKSQVPNSNIKKGDRVQGLGFRVRMNKKSLSLSSDSPPAPRIAGWQRRMPRKVSAWQCVPSLAKRGDFQSTFFTPSLWEEKGIGDELVFRYLSDCPINSSTIARFLCLDHLFIGALSFFHREPYTVCRTPISLTRHSSLVT